jgi:hypothetical protein
MSSNPSPVKSAVATRTPPVNVVSKAKKLNSSGPAPV